MALPPHQQDTADPSRSPEPARSTGRAGCQEKFTHRYPHAPALLWGQGCPSSSVQPLGWLAPLPILDPTFAQVTLGVFNPSCAPWCICRRCTEFRCIHSLVTFINRGQIKAQILAFLKHWKVQLHGRP